jgi:hypothetical protein
MSSGCVRSKQTRPRSHTKTRTIGEGTSRSLDHVSSHHNPVTAEEGKIVEANWCSATRARLAELTILADRVSVGHDIIGGVTFQAPSRTKWEIEQTDLVAPDCRSRRIQRRNTDHSYLEPATILTIASGVSSLRCTLHARLRVCGEFLVCPPSRLRRAKAETLPYYLILPLVSRFCVKLTVSQLFFCR